jgi:hypothetical protein
LDLPYRIEASIQQGAGAAAQEESLRKIDREDANGGEVVALLPTTNNERWDLAVITMRCREAIPSDMFAANTWPRLRYRECGPFWDPLPTACLCDMKRLPGGT